MMEILRNALLRKKLERYIGDKSTLAFITTLLTAGGYVDRRDASFEGYKAHFGQATFEEVKQKLIAEGLLLEKEGGELSINIGIQPSEQREFQAAVEELSRHLFKVGFDRYRTTIKELLSISEYVYVLQELARVGPSIDDTNIGHICNAVGRKYWNQAYKKLEETGLLIHVRSSHKHEYYRLFPPIVFLFKLDPQQEEALLFVYVSQDVGECGVLKEDVAARGYETEAQVLETAGRVQINKWYRFEGYTTTPEGSSIAAQIVNRRLGQAQGQIKETLSALPARALVWLWQEVFSRNRRNEGLVVSYPEIAATFGVSDVDNDRFLCLLNNPRLKEIRDNLLEFLAKQGVAAKVHSYVSTRGGTVRGEVYVFPREVSGFFARVLQDMGLDLWASVFPENLREIHEIWHSVSPWNYHILSRKEEKRTSVSVQKDCLVWQDAIDTMKEVERQGVVQEEADRWRIIKLKEFQEAWRNRYFLPLVEFLLGTESPAPRRVERQLGAIQQGEPYRGAEEKREAEAQGAQIERGVRILLGKVDGEDYFWEPLKEVNPHVLIVGSTGAGKSQTAKALVLQLKKQGIPSFAIDFANEYGDVVGHSIKPGIDSAINPLDVVGTRVFTDQRTSPVYVSYQVSGILGKIYRLGDQQESLLREAILDSYKKAGISQQDPQTWTKTPPSFAHVKAFLEVKAKGKGDEGKRAKSVLNRLGPLFDLQIFSARTEIVSERVYRDGVALFLRHLPTEETKLATAEFFLRWLWHLVLSEGEAKGALRFAIVLDEAYKLAYEGSPVSDILRQGRKYGLGCILCTQQPDDFESKELVFQNTSVQIVLRCQSERHARVMAKQIGAQDWFQEIRELSKFKALVYSAARNAFSRVAILPYFCLKDQG